MKEYRIVRNGQGQYRIEKNYAITLELSNPHWLPLDCIRYDSKEEASKAQTTYILENTWTEV